MHKEKIYGFDLLKFIMALFIVSIHTNLADLLIVNNYKIWGG